MQNFIPPQTQELIDAYLAETPDYIQEVFRTYPWPNEIVKIAAKYRLNTNQVTALVVETFLVITAIDNPTLYVQNLQNHVGIAQSIAEKIALDVVARIIDPMQKLLIENNADTIMYLQDKIAELDAQEKNVQALKMAGLDVVFVDHVSDTDDDDDTLPSLSSAQTLQPRHDPYHEPIEEIQEVSGKLRTSFSSQIEPPVMSSPVPTQNRVPLSGSDPRRGLVVPPPPPPQK